MDGIQGNIFYEVLIRCVITKVIEHEVAMFDRIETNAGTDFRQTGHIPLQETDR